MSYDELAATVSDDYDGLASALAGLAGMVADAGTLERQLTEVANFAMSATPGADGAGVTVVEAGRPDTIVASAQFVSDVDAIQYRLGEGPCISAASSGETMTSPDVGEDDSWPVFGPLAAAAGVRSVISFPLIVNGEVFGSLNVYSRDAHAFHGSSREVGERFAGPAAVAIHNAWVLEQARRTVARMEIALTSRATIDRAIGIVQARSGVSAEDAFVRLRIMSQHQHVKLALVAENLVAEAVRSVRARKIEPGS